MGTPGQKTRLDAVVKVREVAEEAAWRAMADAHLQVQSAERVEAELRRSAFSEVRPAASADDWQLADVAHTRALSDLKSAQERTAERRVAQAAALKTAQSAHQQAEAMRRAAQTKRDALRVEADRRERKADDEWALLNYSRR